MESKDNRFDLTGIRRDGRGRETLGIPAFKSPGALYAIDSNRAKFWSLQIHGEFDDSDLCGFPRLYRLNPYGGVFADSLQIVK